jgi:hypothetical protein
MASSQLWPEVLGEKRWRDFTVLLTEVPCGSIVQPRPNLSGSSARDSSGLACRAGRAYALADKLRRFSFQPEALREAGQQLDACRDKRQVFVVSMGGFDAHDGLLTVHPTLLTSVASALTGHRC